MFCGKDFLHLRGVYMLRTGTGCHAKQAERAIQTVKSRCREVTYSFGFNIPRLLYKYLIMDVIGALNISVNANYTSSTPNVLIMGFRASAPLQYQIPFGTVSVGKTPLHHQRDEQPRVIFQAYLSRSHSDRFSRRDCLPRHCHHHQRSSREIGLKDDT